MKHLEFVKLVNKLLWKSREYIRRLKKYRQDLIEHIEWLQENINKTTVPEIIEQYNYSIQIRGQELAQVEINIILEENKLKENMELEKECNIFS